MAKNFMGFLAFYLGVLLLFSGISMAQTVSLSAGDEITVGGTRVTCEVADTTRSSSYCECQQTQSAARPDSCWVILYQDIFVIREVNGRTRPPQRLTQQRFKGGSLCNGQPSDNWFAQNQQNAKDSCDAAILTMAQCR